MMVRFIAALLILLLLGCSTSRYGVAERYIENEQYDRALDTYKKILDPHIRGGKKIIVWDNRAVTGIGEVYWKMKQFDKAEPVFKRVLDRDPTFGKAAYFLGLTLESTGRLEEALKVYKEYHVIPTTDPYRKVMAGRVDFLTRQKVSHEIRIALQNERLLTHEDAPEKSVGVLYFLSLSDDPQWAPIQKGLAEMMITDLAQIEDLVVIERLRLQYLMDELRLGSTGLVDETTSPRLGKLLGARNLIKGSYVVMPDLTMTIDAGIFPSRNINMPANIHRQGDLSRLFRMEKELVLQVVEHFNITLTAQQRAEILKIPTQNMMAFMYYCQGLDAMDQNDFEMAQEFFKKAVKNDADFEMARDRITSSSLWDVTHSSNVNRFNSGVAEHIKVTPRGIEKLAIEPTRLVSGNDRLQRMGLYHDAGFIPGLESRDTFFEADAKSKLVFPDLGGPPPPPNSGKQKQ